CKKRHLREAQQPAEPAWAKTPFGRLFGIRTKPVSHGAQPPDAEIAPAWDAFLASVVRPASQARIQQLFERGFPTPADVEARLGNHVGQLGLAEEGRRAGGKNQSLSGRDDD